MTGLGARIIAGLAALALLAGLIAWGRHGYALADKWQAHAAVEAGNHRQTKANYRAAQGEARRLEAMRLAAAKARQQEITDDVSTAYARRLADLRARYDRLLAQARARAAGAPGGVAVPGLPGAAARTDEAPGLRLAGPACLSPGERLTAAEQALQLDALIDWVEAQAR